MDYKGIAGQFGSIPQMISALVALAAFALAFISLRRARANHQEASANSIWRDYEKLSFENPAYSGGINSSRINFDSMTFDGSNENFIKYEWFVSITLLASETVLDVFSDQRDWIWSVTRQIKLHHIFIHSDYFRRQEYVEYMSDKMRSIIADIGPGIIV